jgi:SAM-dependent methyltransferase
MSKQIEKPEIPESKIIDKLNEYTYKVGIFQASLELNIWAKVNEGLDTAKQLAAKLGWDFLGTRMLLDDLCSIGLLKKRNDRYGLVKEAEYYLIPGKSTYEGKYLLNDCYWEGNGHLADAIRSGKRPISHNAISKEMVDDWLGVYVPNLLDEEAYEKMSTELWKIFGIQANEGLRVLDVACGPAPRTLMLIRQHPGVQVTLLDWERILDTALDFAHKLEVEKQVTTLSGDLWSTDFGSNQFDLVFLGNITHFFSPEENTRLFQKINCALVAGGAIAISAIRREFPHPTGPGLWFYAVSKGGAAYDFKEYEAMLAHAAFKEIQDVGKGPIKAIKS